MARGSIMLQLSVGERYALDVISVPPIFALVFDNLDGDKTTVREIAVERAGLIWSINVGNWGDFPDNAYALLYLVFVEPNRPLKTLYAPSHVPSPQFQGVGQAILQVFDYGYTITGGSSPAVAFARVFGAHAYLDEIE